MPWSRYDDCMPQVNVTERKVSPKLDQGLITGVYAGAVAWVWMLLIGALGAGSAADFGVYLSATVLGPDAVQSPGFGGDWLIGSVIHFVYWAVLGVVWALLWPTIRRYGTLTPALLFSIAAYVVVVQIILRLIEPATVESLGVSGHLIAFILGGFTFAWRYRRA